MLFVPNYQIANDFYHRKNGSTSFQELANNFYDDLQEVSTPTHPISS